MHFIEHPQRVVDLLLAHARLLLCRHRKLRLQVAPRRPFALSCAPHFAARHAFAWLCRSLRAGSVIETDAAALAASPL
ncbi:MAG: hypothetical protein ACJ8I3_04615, partial [Paraburkholderia graminis]